MKTVIQRVSSASVTVNNEKISEIEQGLLVLLGVAHQDTQEDVDWLCHKIANLRIFADDKGVMNRSVLDENGDVIVVSQFTLQASIKKGNRPSYIHAADPDVARPLYESFCKCMEEKLGKQVGKGSFGKDMKVALLNDGPVTILMDTKNRE